jgi:hypothetical protein
MAALRIARAYLYKVATGGLLVAISNFPVPLAFRFATEAKASRVMSSLMNTASVGGVADDTLDGEFEEKLLLHDGAPPLVARCYERQSERHRRHGGEGGAGVDDGYRERFVRAYDRLRDELVSDDSCELTDEARRWVAQV